MGSTAPVQALVFNVNGTNYDITTATDTSTNLSAQLQSTPWWGTGATNTISFVNAVGTSFGYPNTISTTNHRTPYFAYQLQSGLFDTLFITQGVGLSGVVQFPATVATYAIITPVATVPFDIPGGATIPTLGSVLALGVMRKARKFTVNKQLTNVGN